MEQEIDRLRAALDESQTERYEMARLLGMSAEREAAALAEIGRLLSWELSGREWFDKTDWVQNEISTGTLPPKYLGQHRADVIRSEIERLRAERDALRKDAEMWRKWVPYLHGLRRKPYNLAMDIDAALAQTGENDADR